MAVGAGIGFLIAFVGLQNEGIIVGNEATLVSIDDLASPKVLLSIFGIIVSFILLSLKLRCGIFYGMIITAIVGIIFGLLPRISGVVDIVSSVSTVAPTFGQAFINFADTFTIQMLV